MFSVKTLLIKHQPTFAFTINLDERAGDSLYRQHPQRRDTAA